MHLCDHSDLLHPCLLQIICEPYHWPLTWTIDMLNAWRSLNTRVNWLHHVCIHFSSEARPGYAPNQAYIDDFSRGGAKIEVRGMSSKIAPVLRRDANCYCPVASPWIQPCKDGVAGWWGWFNGSHRSKHAGPGMRALACGPWHAGPGMQALACGPVFCYLFECLRLVKIPTRTVDYILVHM